MELFDVYRGEQVGEGKKSLALRLEFRAPDRTLTDDEVAERRTAIEAALAELGGQAACLRPRGRGGRGGLRRRAVRAASCSATRRSS